MQLQPMASAFRPVLFTILLGTTLFTACTSPEPRLDTSSDAQLSYDGLVPVKNSRFQKAWAAPDIDLSRYTKIIVAPPQFEFRAVRSTTTGTRRSSSDTEFSISEESRKKLIDIVQEVFDEELKKSRYFEFTDQPGPDVLILQGAMLDIVSNTPPRLTGRGDIYLSRVGQITLVLELRDSLSGETLVRAVERRAIEPAGNYGMRSTPVTTWQEVRRLARRWAVKLREGLDSFHTEAH